MLSFDEVARDPSSHGVRKLLLEDASVREALGLQLWAGSDHAATPFGSLLRGLEELDDPPPWQRVSGVRASNILLTRKLGAWGDLAACSAAGLRQLPNLGAKTFLEIVDMTLLAWAQDEHEFEASRGPTEQHATAPSVSAPVTDPQIAEVEIGALADVLRWFWAYRGARTFSEAVLDLRSLQDPDVPTAVRDSADRLGTSQLTKALSLNEFQAEDWEWLLAFDERHTRILEQRVFAEPSITLNELSSSLGVTRERVRQLERQATDELAVRLSSERALGLQHLAARLRREATGLITPERFNELLAGLVLGSDAPPDRLNLCSAVLARTSGEWSTWEGYIAAASLVRVVQRMVDEWRVAGPCSPIPTASLDLLLSRLEVSEPTDELFDSLGIRSINGSAVWWGRTHGDRGVAVLAAYDRVLRFDEIHAEVGPSVSPRSMQNALLADKRIMRRGKETYGLRIWGGEEYTGLYDELEQAITRAGGRTPLEELVERFVEDFGVAASSVLSYAADRRFVKHSDGTLAMRTGADPEVRFSHIPIEQTAGAYRLDGVWHACFEIDDDLARGSGRVTRRGIGQEAGLEPDLTFAVIYDAGTVTFSWGGTQPAIGSLRDLIIHHACGTGDLLLLPLSGVEPRPSRVVRVSERSGWSGLARVAAEMGLDPGEIDENEQPLEVADAVGLPPGADWHAIADRLRERRDSRVVALLPEHLR